MVIQLDAEDYKALKEWAEEDYCYVSAQASLLLHRILDKRRLDRAGANNNNGKGPAPKPVDVVVR